MGCVHASCAIVLPQSSRRLDAFFVYTHLPHIVVSNAHSDFQGTLYPLPDGPGEFELTYCVASANMGIASETFRLSIFRKESSVDEINFIKA